MADLYAWKSTDPEVIAEYERWAAGRIKFSKDSDKLMRRWFGRKKRGKMMTRDRWCGVECLGDEYHNPPVGWRYDRKHGMLVPFRTRAEGKQFAKDMDQCQPPRSPNIKGMSGFVLVGLRFCEPGFTVIDGVAWCWWSCDLKARPKHKYADSYDPKVWKRAKLSEFYAAKESRELADV